MADLKISQLPTATTPLSGAELVPIVQNGTTDQTTVAAITAAVTSDDVTSALNYIPENVANKNQANGYPSLDSTGKVPQAQLPEIVATGTTYVVASQAAMLALSAAVPGSIAVRTDISQTFILTATPPSTLGNWQVLLTPTSPVTSVAGRTGTVTLSASDISGLAPSATTNALDASNISSGTLSADRLPATIDSNALLAVQRAGVDVGIRRALNFIQGSNTTVTVADDPTNERVNVTIAASGGGGGGGGVPNIYSVNGRIGINTATPTTWLEVNGYNIGYALDTGNVLNLRNPATQIGVRGAGIKFFYGTGSVSSAQIDLISATDQAGVLAFSTRNTSGTTAERARFDSTGNFLIGATSGTSPLTVAGLIQSTTGGFKFPDGTTQTTAATGGGGLTSAQAVGRALVFGG